MSPTIGIDSGAHYCLGSLPGRVETEAPLRAIAELPSVLGLTRDDVPYVRSSFVRLPATLHLNSAS